ncbi:MAG TPA: CHAT domain-containing protein [Pyrinomonadaceae bacterium]|nr:CHAT domain-containing protein [Pyrinomonadaceae bacterium]
MATTKRGPAGSVNWDEFEAALLPSARGASKARAADGEALRDQLGDAEFEYLQKLATHSAMMRQRAEPLGSVILVPGIMGSSLSSTAGKDVDSVWLNFARLAIGSVERLRLTNDGARDRDTSLTVAAGEPLPLAYARTILWLRARWRVRPFAFDWRKDVDTASDALAEVVRREFRNQPVHIVAHSMGGLVSRNFIRRHRGLWDGMRVGDDGDARGGRLVMLGTPNYGSFAIPQVLTGTETLVKWLARADLRHSRAEVVQILNTFVGSYQMLPAPSKLPTATQAIYRGITWGDFPVSELHLQRALRFHDELERGGTIDPARMVYIAGAGRETLAGLTVLHPGEFDYTTTFDGDGRVPHALGLLEGVPTYYADASHGDLVKKEMVLSAVDELLERGRTAVLPQEKPVSRSARAEGARWTRGAAGQEVGGELEVIARRTAEKQATREEQRDAEIILQRAVLGQDIDPEEIPQVAAREETARKRAKSIRLEVKAVRGDITRVQAPLLVVGHYQGAAPAGGAEGALDAAIGYWITRANDHGMIGASLGQLFFIPAGAGRMRGGAVLLAGMGEPGKFRRDGDARFLMMNVTLAAATLGLDRFATVVIGSGLGNMSKESALRGMMQGVCEALHRLPHDPRPPLRQLLLVEYDDRLYDEIVDLLRKFEKQPPVEELELKVSEQRLPRASRRSAAPRPPDVNDETDETRINIERAGDTLRFSALTADAVIPVRDEAFKPKYAYEAAERLMASLKQEEQEKYGQLLYTYLFPPDFHQVIDTGRPLTLVLDRATAGLPWEMACFRGPQGMSFLGPDLKLTRQFRTRLSSAPGVTPPPKRRLKALVIADPARDADLQLPGALREGREVVRVLNEFKMGKKNGAGKGLELEVVDRIGSAECDAVEILALILNENFDLIHFAGHGVFDEKDPANSGWVFGREPDGKIHTLSAREIFKARRVPRLVFANACFSAVVRPGGAATADEMNRELAGMAEAFFERGVQNYVGSGWPVGDAQAVAFAEAFYTKALSGGELGEALSDGRRAILGQGSTWGAYHHYGRSNAKLIATK